MKNTFTRISRRVATATLASAVCSAVIGTAPAQAQPAYPSKPITMVVPFPAGGPNDLVARLIARKMSESMGQPVIIENKGGANGNIGAKLVVNAAADGYTLLYNSSAIALSPSLYKNLSYDVKRDLAPVALTAVVPLVLVLSPSVPANSVKEFIAYAKANPGKLSYGSAGNGNSTHLAAFMFVQANGLDAVHIPYKGSAPADLDLVGGQIQFMTEAVNSITGFVRDKRLKMLAVLSHKRMTSFPDVPTLAESGMPGLEVGAWQGVMVPANTPNSVIQRLNAEVMNALQTPEVREKMALMGAEPLGSSPEAYGEFVQKELTRWANVIKKAGVTLE